MKHGIYIQTLVLASTLLSGLSSLFAPTTLHCQIQIRVSTNKPVYEEFWGIIGEPIHITLSAINPTDVSIPLDFLTSCEDYYWIDSININPYQGCLQDGRTYDVPPHDSLTWYYEYPGNLSPTIFSGKHLLIGSLNTCCPCRDTIEIEIKSTREINLRQNWNMVSLPMKVDDCPASGIFPSAIGSAFSLTSEYIPCDTVKTGLGYWVKYPTSGTAFVSGCFNTDDTIDVTPGWNMVGSLSSPVTTSTIGSIPGGIITSHFFEYNYGYHIVDTLKPGRGYWVKVTQGGQLVMTTSTSISPANQIIIQDIDEVPPPPPDETIESTPTSFTLQSNYPNPFNPSTEITYSLPRSGLVTLTVFDILGREVTTLVNDQEEVGTHTIQWNAEGYPSGIYFYRIVAGDFVETKKMVLVK